MDDDATQALPPEPSPSDAKTRVPHPEEPTRGTASAASGAGQRIGPYELIERLGVGGMGEVWLAEQREPVRRQVALKVIKHGMDSKQVVARFESERQALAMMDHPAVAKVFDAGATPNGRPYFVMEHVLGVPIGEHCDEHRLTTPQRLELFQQVCEGVQHAHQKAIIHRDLKPTNVLVSMQDGRSVPKIIDFGVAKITKAHEFAMQTMHTELGALVGTPTYMSPEQMDFTDQNIDTRSDVYSLGVMLYELLVGKLPIDPKELKQASFDEFRRMIREEEPSRPSTRFIKADQQSDESARLRGTTPHALRKQLGNDLDWIVMKALEKDRARRYGSPSDLAADIGRYLREEPVMAGPPGASYRTKKFVRRHRIAVSAAAVGVLVLLAFAVTMTVQAGRIARERDRANREAEVKGHVSEFLKDLFNVSDPSEALGNSITARELLDKGAKKIEQTLTAQPQVQAELMATMGEVYRSLGLYPEAEPLLVRALETRRRALGDEHRETLQSMNHLAILYWYQGRYDEAEPLYVKIREVGPRVLSDDHVELLRATNNLAILYWTQKRFDEAEPLYLETLETRKRTLGDEHPDTLVSMNNLAIVYWSLGRYDEAEPLYVECLATLRRVQGDEHPDTLAAMNNLAELYHVQTRYDEAELLYVETLTNRKRVLGEEHPRTAYTLHHLARLRRDTGDYAGARTLFERAQRIWQDKLGPDHPSVADNLEQYALLLRKIGNGDEAADLEARARTIRQKP